MLGIDTGILALFIIGLVFLVASTFNYSSQELVNSSYIALILAVFLYFLRLRKIRQAPEPESVLLREPTE